MITLFYKLKRLRRNCRELQTSVNKRNHWTKKRRIKLNSTKSVHISITQRYHAYQNSDPYSKNSTKYVGRHLDKRLCSKVRIKKKREEPNIKFRQIYCVLGTNSKLFIDNKLLIYKQILR